MGKVSLRISWYVSQSSEKGKTTSHGLCTPPLACRLLIHRILIFLGRSDDYPAVVSSHNTCGYTGAMIYVYFYFDEVRALLSLISLCIGSIVQPVSKEMQYEYRQKHSPCHSITFIPSSFRSFTFPSLFRWQILLGATVPRIAERACKGWTASRSVCSRPSHAVVRVSTDHACLPSTQAWSACLSFVGRGYVLWTLLLTECHACSATHLLFILT